MNEQSLYWVDLINFDMLDSVSVEAASEEQARAMALNLFRERAAREPYQLEDGSLLGADELTISMTDAEVWESELAIR